MKQPAIIAAYKTIQKYENERLPMKLSYALHKTRVLLQPQWDFQVERERAIFDKYNPKYTESGAEFRNQEEASAFAEEYKAEINELAELDADLGDFVKPKAPLTDDVSLSVDDIAALEPFIEFV